MKHTRWSLLVALALGGFGCEEKARPEGIKSEDAGAPRASKVDKNLAEAVAAVAGQAAPAASGGPPETGVFAPGAADREARPGDAPKLTIGGKGSGPTVTFGSSVPKAGKKTDGRVQVAVQTGPRSALPTVEFLLSIEAAASAGEAAPGAPAGPLDVTVRVAQAKLAAEQPGELPPGVAQEVAKMRGSRFSYQVAPSGAGRLTAVEVSKETEASLGQSLRSAADVLSLAFLPYPTEPIGAGAFWMVVSRDTFAGVDVVTYRMMKLEKVESERAVLSINTKRYAAGGQLSLPGVPPHRIDEFSGTTTGQVMAAISNPGLVAGETQDQVMAGLAPAQGDQVPQGQKMGFQLGVRSRLVIGVQ